MARALAALALTLALLYVGADAPAANAVAVAPPPPLVSAAGQDFAGEPSDVLLTFAARVTAAQGAGCVAIAASEEREAFGGEQAGPKTDQLRLYLAPGGAMPPEVQCAAGEAPIPVAPAAASSGGVVYNPIEPSYLEALPFGETSLTIQPWRAYLDTWPASRLTQSLGINFNVTPAEAEDTAQLLQESGFTLARVELGWNSLSYQDPSSFKNEASVDQRLEALKRHGLRPLILLNANSGEPTPTKSVTLQTTEEAPAGAQTLTLTPASAAQVVPGRTGFSDLTFGGTPDLLIASISGDVATLARRLPSALPAGSHRGATMLYAPFGPPRLEGGQPNPAFQKTLRGWLAYVATISEKAASVFGPEGYDLEVWNELSFGSQFLNEESYYSPAREAGEGSITEALLDETVAFVRGPDSGIAPGVGVSDGFASQTPYVSGATVPPGTTALSKHLYAEGEHVSVPRIKTTGDVNLPIELPEYYLTALTPATITRDLAPMSTSIFGVPHGRDVTPEGGSPPQVWMTEYNLQHSGLIAEREGHPGVFAGEVTPAQSEHLQAEIALRSLVSMIGKGMSREYFYAVSGEGWNLVSEAFMNAVDANPASYPGSALGGETTEALRRLMGKLSGPGPEGPARQLTLLSIAQEGNRAQFSGDGIAPLYNRELLVVLPFESSPRRFVIPVYVMSEDMTTIARPSEPEGSIDRFDLPSGKFRITLGDLPETTSLPKVSEYDPITGGATSARLTSRLGEEATFEVAATSYPRLLILEYGAS